MRTATCNSTSELIRLCAQELHDTNVVIGAGVYELDKPIELNNMSNVNFVGEKQVFISGTVTIGERFSARDNGIFSAPYKSPLVPDGLFVGENAYILCRYPNYKADTVLGGMADNTDFEERARGWKNPAGGYIRALHRSEWGGNDYIITGRNSDGTLALQWVGDNNRGSAFKQGSRVAENIAEELDAQGEWFYDKTTGELRVIPYDGDDLSALTVRAAVTPSLIRLKNCDNITFSDITFRQTSRTLFTGKYEKITRSDWAIVRDGAVMMTGCANIALKGCGFTEIGGNCIFISGKNRDIDISGCTFRDCGASGVAIFGDPSCQRDASTWENHKTEITDFTPGPANDLYPEAVSISDSEFSNLGIYEKQSAPVAISLSHNVSVTSNTIHHVPRAGINICDGAFGGHRIEDNLIYDTVRETGDHGPFNSWGRDRFWSVGGYDTNGGNGAAKKSYAKLDAVDVTLIKHNYISGMHDPGSIVDDGGRSYVFGIDLDDGSSNYTIERNVCVGVGIKLREGFFRTVRGNLIINAALDLHVPFEGNEDLVEGNVVISSRPLAPIGVTENNMIKLTKNLFVGSQSFGSGDILLRGSDNIVSGLLDYSLIGFEPIEMSFGANIKPVENKNNTVKNYHLCGMTLTALDDSLRSAAGTPDCNGAYVLDVDKESLPYKKGIRIGDVIISMNHAPVANPESIDENCRFECVEVFRSQKQLEL